MSVVLFISADKTYAAVSVQEDVQCLYYIDTKMIDDINIIIICMFISYRLSITKSGSFC